MVYRKDTLCNLIGTIAVPNAVAPVVTQGHGGSMTVEAEEGEGAAFIVCLPVQPVF